MITPIPVERELHVLFNQYMKNPKGASSFRDYVLLHGSAGVCEYIKEKDAEYEKLNKEGWIS